MLLFCRGRKEMYKSSKCTCPALVSLTKPFVWWPSCCCCHHSLLKLTNNAAQYPVCHLPAVTLLTNAVWRVKRKRSTQTPSFKLAVLGETVWLSEFLVEPVSCWSFPAEHFSKYLKLDLLNAIQQSLPHYRGNIVLYEVYGKVQKKAQARPTQSGQSVIVYPNSCLEFEKNSERSECSFSVWEL